MSAAAAADVDPTTKQIQIPAALAAGYSTTTVAGAVEPVKGGARSRSRKRKVIGAVAGAAAEGGATKLVVQKVGASVPDQAGAGATSPGTMVQLAATHVPGSNSSKAVGLASELTAGAATVGAVAPAATADPPLKGGEPRVILAKSRKNKSKVVLAAPAKKSLVVDPPVSTQLGGAKARRKTLKKLRVSVHGLGKKLTHAKTIRNKASRGTFADVKAELVKAGLIKADSKAPEGILRQMYADFMVLKKRAL